LGKWAQRHSAWHVNADNAAAAAAFVTHVHTQELFLSSLLPDRKLRVLEAQPLQALPPGKDGERCLLLWGVEDAVKRRYQQFVALLEKCR
jgi:hypothetical protein